MINKKLLILMGVVLGILLSLVYLYAITSKAEATYNHNIVIIPKVNICHFDGKSGNFQTLNVALPAAIAHLAQHDKDYKGECVPDYCPNDEGYQPTGPCEEEEPVVTPTEEPKGDRHVPTFASSSTNAPSCPNGETSKVVANPHVLRAGDKVTVKFFITEGDSANIFYSVVGQPHWGNAVADVKPNSDNFVSFTVSGLDPKLGYDFGIQQKNGCGGGKTTAVVVDDFHPRLFMLSYYE